MMTQILMRRMRPEAVYLLFLLCVLQVVGKLEAFGGLNTFVSKDPSTSQLELGSDVILSCNVKSFKTRRKAPSVSWYKDGARIRGGNTNSGGVYHKMTSVNVTDQGFYQCVARQQNKNAGVSGRSKFVGTTVKLSGYFTTYVQLTIEVKNKMMSLREVNDEIELKVQTYLEEQGKKVTVVAEHFKIRQKRRRRKRRFAKIQLVVYEKYLENNASTQGRRKYFTQLLKHLRRGTRFSRSEGLSVSARSIQIKSLGYCLPSITGKRYLKGKFKLPLTAAGESANVSCPYGPRDTHAQSMCVESASGARWKFFNNDDCNYKSRMTRAFRRLAKEKINKRNARRMAREAKNLTKIAPSKEINEVDVEFLQNIIKGIVNAGELDSNGQDVVDIIDTVLNANDTVFKESQKLNETAKRYIDLIDTIAANLSAPDNGTARQLFSPNLVIQAQIVDASRFPGYRLSVMNSEANRMITKEKLSMDDLAAEKIETGLTIPKNIFQQAGENTEGRLKIAVIVYQNAKFFQTVSADEEDDDADAESDEYPIDVAHDDTSYEFKTIVDDDDNDDYGNDNEDNDNEEAKESQEILPQLSVSSRVISSSIVGVSIKNLTEPVELIFDPLVPKGKFPVCVFWDFEANGGYGNWSTEGCKYVAKSSDRITCQCDHMTNFAVLFTPHGGQVDESHALALSIISYIGCAISLLGMLLTVLTYSVFRSLRKSNAQRILVNFCVAQALLLIVFMAGATRFGGIAGCSAVAALLHYFVLAVVLWMGVEGYQMYLAFVKVLATYQTNFMLKVSVVAWGVPAIIVAITAAVATGSYGNEQYCVLSGVAFYAALFAPSLLVLAANFVIFIFVLWRLYHSHDASADKHDTILWRSRTGLAIMVLLGLTWVFGAFAIKDAKLVFEYLFCIFNSLQGFFIFIFHCVRRPEVRTKWRGIFGGNKLEYLDSTKSTVTKTRSIRANSNCATAQNI